jgi:Uri superfamily endonuclease
MSACTKLCRTVKPLDRHASAASLLPPGGTYTVLLWLPAAAVITIGRLGDHTFPRGYYTYTGSAKRGLAARLHRHLHGATTRHWHVDYLRPYTRVLAWQAYPEAVQPECELARRLLAEGQVVVPKFGASDCSCASHLVYYPGRRRPSWGVPETSQAVCRDTGQMVPP